jgi:type IX secretion system PorP/SprF family membrane protein
VNRINLLDMRKFKNIIALVLFFCFAYTAMNAQSRYFDERAVYSQHFISPVLINPGATGINDYQQILFNYRNKWASFDGAPTTITFAYSGPVGNRLSIGGMLMRDSYGILETNKAQFNLAYTIESEINKVSFGLSTEYIEHKATGRDLSGSLVDLSDEVLLARFDGDQFFDASFGVFGVYNNALVYGLSFPSLISSRINESLEELPDRDFSYIMQLGYRFTTSDSQIKMEPSLVIKSLMNVPTHIDINMKMSFLEDRFTGGVAYTLGAEKGLGFLIGTSVDNINLNYMYDVSALQFQDYNSGSHEIGITIDIGKEKKK